MDYYLSAIKALFKHNGQRMINGHRQMKTSVLTITEISQWDFSVADHSTYEAFIYTFKEKFY